MRMTETETVDWVSPDLMMQGLDLAEGQQSLEELAMSEELPFDIPRD